MNILLIGAGGREHAFAWKISQSKLCQQLFIAPGNAGTASCGINLPVAPTDFAALAVVCVEYRIGMIVIGPEEPLVKGIYDFMKTNPATSQIPVIGPSQAAAQLEGSKAFAKSFMKRHDIPTAAYKEFSKEDYSAGLEYLSTHSLPVVLKADGLAAGKGVLICQSHAEAMSEYELMLMQSKFGEAGSKVVVEEFLKGIELSVFVLTDGEHYLLLPEAKDYKRIGNGDTGLNTGGMGAISPVPFADRLFLDKVTKQIIEPTIAGLKKDELEYKGFIFFGLMNCNGNPYVIEYNCRMGDPETEAVIPRIKNDFVELLMATSQQRINEFEIETDNRSTATIVAVSEGYPGHYENGRIIRGLKEAAAAADTVIFQSGTRMESENILTNGGRVLAITSFGESISEAVQQSVNTLQRIHFDGMYYRDDIGYEFK